MNEFTVQKVLIAIFTLSLYSLTAIAGRKHSDVSSSDQDNHTGEVVRISDETAIQNGISATPVLARDIASTSTLYGRISADPASLSHIRARFDGVIENVKVNIGDHVKKGDVLAVVESNESLKSYSITSPIDGNVIARHANNGELSNGQVLFSLANHKNVWAQLTIFSQALSSIRVGQSVKLSHADFNQTSKIAYITPSADGDPHSLANVSIDNSTGYWPLGALVKAQVTTSTKSVSHSVPLSAVQEYKAKRVVFVVEGDEYTLRTVKLGVSDGNYIEVVSGLETGEQVVASNSYIIRADLEKSEAGHAH